MHQRCQLSILQLELVPAKAGVTVATTIMVARIGIVNNGILFLIIGFSIGWITLSFVNRLI